MGRLFVGVALALGVVVPGQVNHARHLTRVRPHAWLKRPPDTRPPQDLRSDAEKQRDYQVWLHYQREAQLDAVATAAARQSDDSMLARAEAVRRLERDRFRRSLRWLARHPEAVLAELPADFTRPGLAYSEANVTSIGGDFGSAGESLADLERQVLRELRERKEESDDDPS